MAAGLMYNKHTRKMVVLNKAAKKHRDRHMLGAAVGWEFQSRVVSKQTQFFKNPWFCVYPGFGYLGPSITCGSKTVRQQTEWMGIFYC